MKQVFVQLSSNYSNDLELVDRFWNEIETAYSGKGRHYHTLAHLENIYVQMLEVQTTVSDWNTMLFTLFYHDAVYDASKHNNEEKSAALAEKRMQELGVTSDFAEKCVLQILATKSHQLANDEDINLFTDADLSILGMEWEDYKLYCGQVRKEYRMYPDFLYNPGRKKVLQRFLGMERIFKTAFFYQQLEEQARENIRREMSLL